LTLFTSRLFLLLTLEAGRSLHGISRLQTQLGKV
jgi:hypothetical protein